MFTGEPIEASLNPSFYDSSADTNNIQYPHFFVKLLKTKEDRLTGRVIPPYGQNFFTPIDTAPKAWSIVARDEDGQIASAGNTITTSTRRIRLIQPGQLLRVLNGNNIGTYIISSVTINSPSTITVSNTLLSNLPISIFDPNTNNVYFTSPVDLQTIKINDNFIDVSSNKFLIVEINSDNSIKVQGPGTPNLAANSQITRTGNVFQSADSSNDTYLVMDPTKPIIREFQLGEEQLTTNSKGRSASIPIDAYYLVRIDSKERDTHIEIMNRMWEEFNPPRTALPTIVRSPNSFDQILKCDAAAGTQLLTVEDNSGFNINDTVFVFDDHHPTKGPSDNFEIPFSAKVIAKIEHNKIEIDTPLTSNFTIEDVAKVVSNAYYYLHMFHFVEHNTRDNEGAQYWVHEFTFWVQIFVDRLETPAIYTPITRVGVTLEDSQGNIIIQAD